MNSPRNAINSIPNHIHPWLTIVKHITIVATEFVVASTRKPLSPHSSLYFPHTYPIIRPPHTEVPLIIVSHSGPGKPPFFKTRDMVARAAPMGTLLKPDRAT